jgi:transposase
MEHRERGRRRTGDLRRNGTLNPRPDCIRNELFSGEFFDPDDMMQVKYEMLRAVEHDGRSITEATAEFGLSRPVFYRVRRDFEAAGLAGLLPRKRGPKNPRKLSPEVLEFISAQMTGNKRIRTQELRDRIEAKFGAQVHTRTVRRAMLRGEKGGHRG